jgi:mannan endo-1,6-alpha-mannosidase
MFGSLIDYWYFTGDDQYNAITMEAMLHQVGDQADFMPTNQTRTLGNDDQSFWAIAAMQAAEYLFPNPPADQPQWLALVQAVFNEQTTRWDSKTCGGGLRWQIFQFNNGYNYKNSISNGCFFNLAARLGKYTGNQTYIDWAEKIFEWMEGVSLMDDQSQFHDGATVEHNCTDLNPAQFSYNAGIFLYGAATMWNVTGSEKWKQHTLDILNGADLFFSKDVPDVMFEWNCEQSDSCNNDQRSFKAYLSRWMAATTKVAPFTTDLIMPKLRTSAQYAAMQCSGGDDGNTCGLKWTQGSNYDGSAGPGEQMAALEVFQSNLNHLTAGPLGKDTGATSKGDPNAGSDTSNEMFVLQPITTGDRVGATFLTLLIVGIFAGGAYWMVM